MKSFDDPKELVQQAFGRSAQAYVTSQSHAKGDDLSLLVEWLDPQPDWRVLDVATGGGHVAKSLARHTRSVYATDLTPNMLRAAREHLHAEGILNVEYVLADAENLPFLESTFDAVTCRIAPHHFPDPRQFAREVRRVLRPGGSFVLIDNVAPADPELAHFMNTFERMRDASHVRCPSTTEWSAWLTEAGLTLNQSRLRKKTYAFSDWASRMLKSDADVARVRDYLLDGSVKAKAYFSVRIESGQVLSLQVDEWMALWTHPEQPMEES